MGLPLVVFLFVVVLIMGTYAGMAYLPSVLASREMDRRLKDVSGFRGEEGVQEAGNLVLQVKHGTLPIIDRVLTGSNAGGKLKRMIEQSGMETTPSTIVVACLVGAGVGWVVASLFTTQWFAPPMAAFAGFILPIAFVKRKASGRIRKFEEQFPEALDLLSRAIRAGHAFQTAMGMVADELPDPVGPEFKKTFDQQNYGLPLKEALNELADRIGLLDVRFFVTAILIQRDTGGNLSEILDNLAHVIRERFKILRQVRVYTAHGRLTGYVLLALPVFLMIALAFINPDHMNLLFREHIGHMLLGAAAIMQVVGYFWIRHVVKIEV